ncbi:uncharacterized protein LOC114880244 [Osmia bicornis bicornis]|uniref:uncharacterized protein LOC114880244 n=1 Tax=Osmia bicornis bicornis TaxID=1437191 RepID=UPI0010F835EC|nr:uncharacterized protein LOC114880244 [Osmia bicornis bicornis]
MDQSGELKTKVSDEVGCMPPTDVSNLTVMSNKENSTATQRVSKVKIIEEVKLKGKFKVKKVQTTIKGLDLDERKRPINEKELKEHSLTKVEVSNFHFYSKAREDPKGKLYNTELVSGEYTVCINLKKDSLSTKRKFNLIKIYNTLNYIGVRVTEIRMVAKAQSTFRDRWDANKVIGYGSKKEARIDAYVPRRKRTRRGVIKEWKGSIDELKVCLMAGQGITK